LKEEALDRTLWTTRFGVRRCSDWEKKVEYRGIEVRFPAGMEIFLLYISVEYFMELTDRMWSKMAEALG